VLQQHEVTPVGGDAPERVDVRILAATHRDLDAEVASGGFREDLLYRLRVVPLHLPPLRERREDIPALAEHFVARYAGELTGGDRVLTESARELLVRHDWPGNVRELENAIKRALVLSSAEILSAEDFAFIAHPPGDASTGKLADGVRAETQRSLDAGDDEIYRRLIERVERPLLEVVLEQCGYNQLRAASRLGINRNTLRKKIGELGVRMRRRP